jgi:hypothetical protein
MRRASVLLLGLCFSGLLWGGAPQKEQIKGLDEQVQEIKSDVLAIAAELSRLEEKLLYPSGTQLSLFVSLAKDNEFRLDSIDVRIGDSNAASHIYTFKELEALQKGGVQRIYTGNVRTGAHDLQVTVAGKSATGADYRHTAAATITKDAAPKLVEIRLAGPGSSQPVVEFKDR